MLPEPPFHTLTDESWHHHLWHPVNTSSYRIWNRLLQRENFAPSCSIFTQRAWHLRMCQILWNDSRWPWRIHILQPINHFIHHAQPWVKCSQCAIFCSFSVSWARLLIRLSAPRKHVCFGVTEFIYLHLFFFYSTLWPIWKRQGEGFERHREEMCVSCGNVLVEGFFRNQLDLLQQRKIQNRAERERDGLWLCD